MGIEALLIRNQCRWAGHVLRMDDERIPKTLLFGQIQDAPCRTGRPLLRYKDKLKSNFKALSLDINTWEVKAINRDTWRSLFYDKLNNFELNRLQQNNELAALAKVRKSQPHIGPWFSCSQCSFESRSKAGLASHTRKHQRTAEAADETNLTCTACNKTCKSKGGLKLHMKTHKT